MLEPSVQVTLAFPSAPVTVRALLTVPLPVVTSHATSVSPTGVAESIQDQHRRIVGGGLPDASGLTDRTHGPRGVWLPGHLSRGARQGEITAAAQGGGE